MDVLSYNRYLSEYFASNPSVEVLSRYVVSETLSPIGDYPHAIKLIRDNYPLYTDTTLLIIGAYLASGWTYERNDLLEMLNNKIEQLSERDKAIVYYLNAYHLRTIDENYIQNPAYLENLCKSTEIRVPFVSNYLYLSEAQEDRKSSEVLFEQAIRNIQKIYSSEEIAQLAVEQFTSPVFFINEFILRTHLSHVTYESIIRQQNFLANKGGRNK